MKVVQGERAQRPFCAKVGLVLVRAGPVQIREICVGAFRLAMGGRHRV
jgi:hypothetical protein